MLMLKLIAKDGLLFAEAHFPFKNQNKFESVMLVMDTGGVLTIVDTSIVNFLGYSVRDAFKMSTLDGAAGSSRGYVIRLPVFRCLGYEMKGFDIACHDMNTRLGVAGILGMNFLRSFRIDLNYRTGEIHLMEKVE